MPYSQVGHHKRPLIIIGVQECVADGVFEVIEALQLMGCFDHFLKGGRDQGGQ